MRTISRVDPQAPVRAARIEFQLMHFTARSRATDSIAQFRNQPGLANARSTGGAMACHV
jgi:hypothetical protein